MTSTMPDAGKNMPSDTEVGIQELLAGVEALLNPREERYDAEEAEAIGDTLRRLHVACRRNRAAIRLRSPEDSPVIPVEHASEQHRLDAEHPHLLGMLDRLIRNAETIADLTLEDQEVFTLRCRELLATIRRHEAEEDRLFFLAVWRDTGGEAG